MPSQSAKKRLAKVSRKVCAPPAEEDAVAGRQGVFRDRLGVVERVGLRLARCDVGVDGNGTLAQCPRDGLIGADRLGFDHARYRDQLTVVRCGRRG